MIPCLLCPSPAVADSLCVPCGALKWAAKLWVNRPGEAAAFYALALEAEHGEDPERAKTIREINTPSKASDFLAHLEAAKAARLRQEGACPECERITPRDPHKENCSKGMV